MRIIITKNGTKIAKEFSPTTTINYNSLFLNSIVSPNNQKSLPISRSLTHLKKSSKSLKKISYSQSSANISSNRNINDILSNLKNKEKINITDDFKIEEIQIRNHKKVVLPKDIQNKLFLYEENEHDNKNKQTNIIPQILLSINTSMDKDMLSKKMMKKTRTLSHVLINSSENNNNQNSASINDFDNSKKPLPKIRPSFPLKYIINKDSYERINKEINSYEEKNNLKKTYISNIINSPKNKFKSYFRNEIGVENRNLIEYLNGDKNISSIFLKKIALFNKEKINKLDVISKKLLFRKGQDMLIQKNIQQKLKNNIMNINMKFKSSLQNIEDKLKKSKVIIKKELSKMNINDKNRYIEQFLDAEKNWIKYSPERFYKKSSPPKRSSYGYLVSLNN